MVTSVPSGTTLLLIFLLVVLHLGFSITTTSAVQSNKSELTSRRNLVPKEDEEEPPLLLGPPPNKKPTLETTKNKTKSIKSAKPHNSTTTSNSKIKLSKLNTTLNPTLQTKNQTKLLKPKKSNFTTTTTTTTKTKIKLNKLNTTLNSTTKSSNSTKIPKLTNPISKSNSTKLSKLTKPLFKSNSTKTQEAKPLKSQKKALARDPPPTSKNKPTTNSKPKLQQPTKQTTTTITTTNGDLIADFRNLPSRLLPDLEQLSISSKAYISIASRHITKSVKPYVGNKHAPAVAAAASVVLLALPLLLLALALCCLNTHLSLQQVLVFAQAYLAIYFATLALAAVATGMEPLRFLYAAAPSSYACMQAFQAVGYVVYLLVQVVVLVVTGGGARVLGVIQMMIGLAVGLHYYTVVLHRAVAGEPPRTGWKVHAAYAACFVVICACARAERRKKAYLLDGREDDGKKS